MKNSIFGLETEYGAYPVKRQTNKPINMEAFSVKIDEYLKELIQYLIKNNFLENGARFYVDTGQHPELATPECSLVDDGVRYTRACNEILYSMKLPLEDKFKKNGLDIKITFRADNKAYAVPDASIYTTYGAHENYLMKRELYKNLFRNENNSLKYLLSFLATRVIYTGSGAIFMPNANENPPKPYGFVISPRAFFTECEVGTATTNQRPMANQRDEAHADPEEFARLHILCGETNRSDWSNWLKIGTTALVVAILNNKPRILNGLPLTEDGQNLASFRNISKARDPNRENFYYQGEQRMSPVKFQRLLLERVGEYVSQMPTREEENRIVEAWAKVLVMLENNDPKLDKMLDWKIKEKIMTKYAERKNIKAERMHDWDLAQIDIKYHDLGPNGLFEILEKEGAIERICTDEEIIDAMISPPKTTRALIRGNAIKFANQLEIMIRADWEFVNLYNIEYPLLNPFATHDQRLEDFIRMTLMEKLKKSPH
ncbi:MAG: proteasome accessory factor PafA2 family protein [Candidatus Niyogibacteria bacterium]|nr:proteasome accessory factor PafA2 family protein [Candidatus Niyogibacteria bacterium]